MDFFVSPIDLVSFAKQYLSLNNVIESNLSCIPSLILFIITIFIVYYVYIVLTFTEIVVDMSECKFNKSAINPYNNNKNDLPPPYPNGWIPVLESQNIKSNQIKPIFVFGYELVVFRGNSGEVHVLDAFCPHLGANLGVGGKVVDHCGQDCIRCPFHGWTFRGSDGMCTTGPLIKSSDDHLSNARIRVWKNIEINGIIFVWHHIDGQNPDWLPIKIQEIQDSNWIYRGRTEHIVNCHFQEIPENGADIAHLQELHKPGVMFGTVLKKFQIYDLLSNVLHHEWTSNWWTCSAPNKHIAMMTLENKNILFGYNLFSLNFQIQQIGPACVHLKFSTPLLGGITGTFIQMLTPLEPNKHKIVHHVYTEPTIKGKLFSKFLLYGEARMIERDIIIWNNKKFLTKPFFTKNEKTLVKFRRWFSQFYTDSSYSYKQNEW